MRTLYELCLFLFEIFYVLPYLGGNKKYFCYDLDPIIDSFSFFGAFFLFDLIARLPLKDFDRSVKFNCLFFIHYPFNRFSFYLYRMIVILSKENFSFSTFSTAKYIYYYFHYIYEELMHVSYFCLFCSFWSIFLFCLSLHDHFLIRFWIILLIFCKLFNFRKYLPPFTLSHEKEEVFISLPESKIKSKIEKLAESIGFPLKRIVIENTQVNLK